MSYDIKLHDPISREPIELEAKHFMRGGTYAIDGTSEAWLSITYNYSEFYYEAEPEKGIRAIYGMTGAESIPVLQNMIDQITKKYPNAETSENYWNATPGNAIKPLHQLIAMAKMRPDGVWDGD